MVHDYADTPAGGERLKSTHVATALTKEGPRDAYRSGGFNNYTISELLRPFQQMANLCGMKWLPPRVIHSVLPAGIGGFKNVSDDDIREYAKDYKEYLEGYTIE